MSAIFINTKYPTPIDAAAYRRTNRPVDVVSIGTIMLRLRYDRAKKATTGSSASTRPVNFGSAVSVSIWPRRRAAVANQRGQAAQHLAQVAARLALNEERRNEHLGVERPHALLHAEEGMAYVGAQPLLVVNTRELVAERRGDLVAAELERRLERETGPHRVHDHVDRVGQLLLEFLGPAFLHLAHDHERRHGAEQGAEPCGKNSPLLPDQEEERGRNRAPQHELAD